MRTTQRQHGTTRMHAISAAIRRMAKPCDPLRPGGQARRARCSSRQDLQACRGTRKRHRHKSEQADESARQSARRVTGHSIVGLGGHLFCVSGKYEVEVGACRTHHLVGQSQRRDRLCRNHCCVVYCHHSFSTYLSSTQHGEQGSSVESAQGQQRVVHQRMRASAQHTLCTHGRMLSLGAPTSGRKKDSCVRSTLMLSTALRRAHRLARPPLTSAREAAKGSGRRAPIVPKHQSAADRGGRESGCVSAETVVNVRQCEVH